MMSSWRTSHSDDFACMRWMIWLRTSLASAASSFSFTFSPCEAWAALKSLIDWMSEPLVSLPAHIVTVPFASLASASVGAFLAPAVAPCPELDELEPPPLSEPHPAATNAAAATSATIVPFIVSTSRRPVTGMSARSGPDALLASPGVAHLSERLAGHAGGQRAQRAGGLERVAARLARRLARPAPPLVLHAQVGERRVLRDDQLEHRPQVRLRALGLGEFTVDDAVGRLAARILGVGPVEVVHQQPAAGAQQLLHQHHREAVDGPVLRPVEVDEVE